MKPFIPDRAASQSNSRLRAARVRTSGRLRLSRLLGSMCLVVLASNAIAVWHAPPVLPWAHGYPVPPPPFAPSIFQRFLALYAEYQSMAADSKPPFAVWLVMNGVSDPETHRSMMLLYVWILRVEGNWVKAH